MSDKDFRTLEQKIRAVVREGANAYRNDKAREKVTNVGRPETAPDNFDPRSRLAKQGEIKTKIIDEADIKLKGDKTEVDLDPKTDDRMDIESTDVRKKAPKNVVKEEGPITPRWEDIKGPEKKGTAIQDYKFQRPPGTTPPASSSNMVGRAVDAITRTGKGLLKGAVKRAGGVVLGVVDPDELLSGEKEWNDKRIADIAKEKGIKPGDPLPPATAPAPKEAPSKDDDLKDLSGNVDIAGGGAKYPEPAEKPAEKEPMRLTIGDSGFGVKRSIERDNPGTPAPPEKKATPAPKAAAPKPAAPKPAAPKAAEPKAPEPAPEKVVPRGGSKGAGDAPDDRYAGAFSDITQASPEKRKEMVKRSRQEAGLEEGYENMFSKEEIERLEAIEENLIGRAGKWAWGKTKTVGKFAAPVVALDVADKALNSPESPAEKDLEPTGSPADTAGAGSEDGTNSNKKKDLDMSVLDKYEKQPEKKAAPAPAMQAPKKQSGGSMDSMSFGDAFKAARAKAKEAGAESTGQFTWRGKQYQTNVKGEKYVPMSKQTKIKEDVEFSTEEIERINAIYEAETKIKEKNPPIEIDVETSKSGKNLPATTNKKPTTVKNLPATVGKTDTPAIKEPKANLPATVEPKAPAGKTGLPSAVGKSKKGKLAATVGTALVLGAAALRRKNDPKIKTQTPVQYDEPEPDDEPETKTPEPIHIEPETKSKEKTKQVAVPTPTPIPTITDLDEPEPEDETEVVDAPTPMTMPSPIPSMKVTPVPPPPSKTPPKPPVVPPTPKPVPMPKSSKAKESDKKGGGTWYYEDPVSGVVRTWGNTEDGKAPWKPQGGANKEKFTSPGGQLNVGPDTENRGVRGSTFGKDKGPSVKDTSYRPEVSAWSTEDDEKKPSKKKAVKESYSKETPMFKSDNRFGSSDSLIAAAKAVMEAKYKNEKELAAMGHPKDKITKKDVLIARGVIAKEDVASPAATKPPAERSQQAKPPANVPLPPRRPASLKQKGDDESDPAKTTGMRTFE